MNTRHPVFWFFVALFAIFLAIGLIAETAATQSEKSSNPNSTINHLDGLTVVTFSVNPGRIKVYLPDDMAAGDTISGTVVEEPKGNTSQEKETNKSALDGMVIDFEGTRVQASQPNFIWLTPAPQPGPPRYQLKLIEIPKGGSSGKEYIYVDCFITTYTWPKISVSNSTGNVEEGVVNTIPSLGQTGRPNQITGSFDGKSDNTILKIGGQPVVPLAESPRKVVFESPTNQIGPVELSVKEGDKETKGTYRNVGVNLTAPKTSLLKGERTELRVEVSGLQGIKQPVPLTLDSMGVITMEGGTYQPLMIQPSQVGADGRFTTTRGITGVQTGAWTSTATVVTTPFDLCLQDDLSPERVVVFNSFTGEFKLCAPQVNSFGGSGTIAIKGNTLTLEQNAPDHRVLITFIADAVREGNAQVKTSNPKQAFTITDRDTRNNTCVCR